MEKVFEFGLPPVVPNIEETLSEYTNKSENLSIFSIRSNLSSVPLRKNINDLFDLNPIQLSVDIQVRRNPKTGKITEYGEILSPNIGFTSRNSTSLLRGLVAGNERLTGSSANYPFWPGGFEESNSKEDTQKLELDTSLTEGDFLWRQQGIVEGIKFDGKTKSSISQSGERSQAISKTCLNLWSQTSTEKIHTKKEPLTEEKRDEIDSLIGLPRHLTSEAELASKPSQQGMKISQSTFRSSTTFMPWAEMVNINSKLDDFHQKIPDMAFKYPFELDSFQKHAILKLEEHENVFVAAHTSAGKTVVAEYAIALSARHMTKSIYTSPIKALSNQKFRDFRNSFDSVGLVTGDVQINPAASCLIMTTEILRSMLYNGSDVIRDLEWVIFDEIHYLNNAERGHVWEEVLIMLPKHVSIIMLSATVPNALQFANWVGEIKKKKIHVIATTKRPVPLEHYIYTGKGGKSDQEMFLIMDSEGKYLHRGYDKAIQAKLDRMSQHQKQFGPKQGNQGFNEKSEKTIYVAMINYLKKTDNLPVVVFTFSRNRCDTYARIMSSLDLTTGAQKAEITQFFRKSISHLKGTDRELPQVKAVEELLKNGVGVHHSGILPILKEVVEMLFQRGLVKLLFATETFAMGVNMPARCVVFDSSRKHDGFCFRTLNPAEYIQMAGRSGRRGLDTTGTVILLCKQHIPDETDIKRMLLGKAAKLESQFRLTYSMILNLLRVESLTVEDVMKRSFLEAGSRKLKTEDISKRMTEIQVKIDSLQWKNNHDEALIQFYQETRDLLLHRDQIMEQVLTQPKLKDSLCPGRIVIIENLPHFTARYGVILTSTTIKEGQRQKPMYQTFLLKSNSEVSAYTSLNSMFTECDAAAFFENVEESLTQKYLQFSYFFNSNSVSFEPDFSDTFCPHTVVSVRSHHILEVADAVLRLDVPTIINNVKKRESARFANDPVAPAVRALVADLCHIHQHRDVPLLNPLYMMVLKDLTLSTQLTEVIRRKQTLKSRNMQSMYPDFTGKFLQVFIYMKLRDEAAHMQYLMSPQSLRLHEEYESRILVLRKMSYIDAENIVQLKGRVACEMGNKNELMVTEMILNNTLLHCTPEEVAALLSCLVVEAKNIEEPELPDDFPLKKKIQEAKDLALQIAQTQLQCGIKEPVDQFVEQFKFGLVEVVYEWARGKPFADIMKLTDAQEGLIVRTIQRLDEMLRDVKDAARIIGDPSLKKKMEEASACIKRDIVFAASLYTQ